MENKFGTGLRRLRESAGMTQKDLAEKSGLSQNGISQWEANKREPGWSQVLKLAEALGVDCRAFMEEPASAADPGRSRPKPPADKIPVDKPAAEAKPKQKKRT